VLVLVREVGHRGQVEPTVRAYWRISTSMLGYSCRLVGTAEVVAALAKAIAETIEKRMLEDR
jgi:hypothetical protein